MGHLNLRHKMTFIFHCAYFQQIVISSQCQVKSQHQFTFTSVKKYANCEKKFAYATKGSVTAPPPPTLRDSRIAGVIFLRQSGEWTQLYEPHTGRIFKMTTV